MSDSIIIYFKNELFEYKMPIINKLEASFE